MNEDNDIPNIIVRPHPAEDHSEWEKKVKNFKDSHTKKIKTEVERMEKDIELRKQKADCVAYIGLIFQLQISLLQYEHDLLTCIEHKVFERTTCREKICFNDTKESFQVEGNKIITFLKKLDILPYLQPFK